jgi:hypothetical protein
MDQGPGRQLNQRELSISTLQIVERNQRWDADRPDILPVPRHVLALARRISTCPLVERSRGDLGILEPCHDVVILGNNPLNAEHRRSPEPWIGHLAQARMLFVSSNPNGLDGSHGANSASPLDDLSIVLETEFAFDPVGPAGPSVQPKYVDLPRTSWEGALVCSRQVFGTEVRPGYDYAQTEVVHCGSAKQAGVEPALPVCVAMYLTQVLRAAAAPALIVVGAIAQDAFRRFLDVDVGPNRMWGPRQLFGRQRVVVAVAHPAARNVDENRKYLSIEQMDLIKARLGIAKKALDIDRRSI